MLIVGEVPCIECLVLDKRVFKLVIAVPLLLVVIQ